MSCDLHRHDQYSLFDGYGDPKHAAIVAKEKGYTALSITNHGTVNGLVQHHHACKEVGIKPILGVEAYFKPKLNGTDRKLYHICFYCKNTLGYKNLNKMLFVAEQQKYYKPYVTLKDLRKYHKGLICSTACVAGFASQLIIDDPENGTKRAIKFLETLYDIFEDDLYIEIQPYAISEKGLQEKVNIALIEIAEQLNIPCILTSDSHYTDKEEFNSYLKMHAIQKHKLDDIEGTYKERFMPTPLAIKARFIKMHEKDFGYQECDNLANDMLRNINEIVEKIDGDILGKLRPELPIFNEEKDSMELLKQEVIQGLKSRNKWKKTYVNRCKEELKVIESQNLADYFLIVQDYIRFAKRKGIAVGPGRGSGCNCLVNYALAITEVDPIYFDLDFRRFLRMDKIKMPKYWAFVVNCANRCAY